MTCGSGITTVNSPSSSTLQCGRWLWDDMPLNSPKRPPHWNSTSGFDFGQITAVDSYPNRTTLGRRKITSCRFSRWWISTILDFRGPVMSSLKSPCTTSFRSSIETMALNCLPFEKIAFFVFLATNRHRRTDGQARCMKPLSLSRAAA